MLVAVGLGLLIGLSLGALGGGGSILTVPALVYIIGQGAREATTSSLFIVGITGLMGALGHARSGRVRWGMGTAFGLAGVVASFAGAAVNRLVDPNVLLLAFSGLIVVAAVGMFAKSRGGHASPSPDRQVLTSGGSARWSGGAGHDGGTPLRHAPEAARPPFLRQRSWGRIGKILVAGLAVGFLTGFFGVGGGFVIVPALTLALGLSMPEAVATSLLVIAINSGASLAARVGTAHFDWAVIAPFTLAAIAGSLVGKKVADRVSGAALTRSFAALLVVVAIYTASSSIIALAR